MQSGELAQKEGEQVLAALRISLLLQKITAY